MALPLSYICIQSVEEKHKTENVNSKTEHNLRLYTIIAGLSVMFIIWFSTVLNQDDAIKLLSQITTTDAGLNMYNDIYKLESSYWHIKLIFIIKFIMWIALAFIKLSKGQVQPFIIKTVRSEIYDDNDFVSDRFFVLRQAYTMYSEVCKKLSNYYSFPLLFSMGWFSCEIIYCSYYIILSFLFPDSTKSKAKLFVLFYWIIIETVPIIILTNNVTKIMNEVWMKATSGIVYIILAQSTVFDKIQNEKLYLLFQLNAFGLELLHKKISFSAYGIFSLDNQLLQSISGTVVTYLVILIQFQMSLKKNKS
ncbi:putative gustatory receptor 28b [Aphidius gifuensis]|uniref:putative gustatory receptor 28b n=1 Tax=Aphidius gifuensis TaxID=684658 RepID=UPI001CDD7FFD|nr:putative gustatory receptor 28b [Aphidius gifuensis]